MPILVLRLRETDGTKARKCESSIEVSKMLGLVCLGHECGPLRKVMDALGLNSKWCVDRSWKIHPCPFMEKCNCDYPWRE